MPFFFDLTSRYRLEFQPSVLTLEKKHSTPCRQKRLRSLSEIKIMSNFQPTKTVHRHHEYSIAEHSTTD